jgi:hypothetical protein
MLTLYITHDTTLYEVVAGRKPDQPTRIQIHSITRFQHSSAGELLKWEEVPPDTQILIRQKIQERFST